MNAPAQKQVAKVQITINPAHLQAALKAVSEFVSKDPTRFVQNNVYVEPVHEAIRFTATDGHTLCSVDVSCDASTVFEARMISKDQANALFTKAKGLKGVESATFELEDDSHGNSFPEYRRVIPAKSEKGAETQAHHRFNMSYLARLGHVQKCLKGQEAVIQLSKDGTEPLRADFKLEGISAVVLVMPCRL